jgi:Protein of unknown function (DUF3277)
MATKTFDPNQLTMVFGTSIMTGYADGTMLSIAFDEQRYNTEVDANGNSIRYKINNNNATITITLNQASPSNDVLSVYMNLDRQSDTGVFPISIKDNRGSSLFTSIGAYVESTPSVEFGTTGNNREWVIKATDVGFFVGGLN